MPTDGAARIRSGLHDPYVNGNLMTVRCSAYSTYLPCGPIASPLPKVSMRTCCSSAKDWDSIRSMYLNSSWRWRGNSKSAFRVIRLGVRPLLRSFTSPLMLTGGLPRRDTLKLGAEVRYRLFPEIVGTGVGAVIAFRWGVTISGAVSGNRLLPSPHSRVSTRHDSALEPPRRVLLSSLAAAGAVI